MTRRRVVGGLIVVVAAVAALVVRTGAEEVDSDLRGARLDGAKLQGATWTNVVRPDGHKSQGPCPVRP